MIHNLWTIYELYCQLLVVNQMNNVNEMTLYMYTVYTSNTNF